MLFQVQICGTMHLSAVTHEKHCKTKLLSSNSILKSSLVFPQYHILYVLSFALHSLTYNNHSRTLSGTSSQEGAPDWLVVLPELFPAGQGYWQSHLALPHQWPKPGPPSSLHWLPIKKNTITEIDREARKETRCKG